MNKIRLFLKTLIFLHNQKESMVAVISYQRRFMNAARGQKRFYKTININ